MPARNPSERAMQARIMASERWAHTDNRTAATAPARKALMERFEREVDPEGTLDPAERAIRAGHARRAFYTRLALKSARARRRAAELTAEAEAAESELSEVDGAA